MIDLDIDGLCTECSSPYNFKQDEMKTECSCCRGPVDSDIAIDAFVKSLTDVWHEAECGFAWYKANNSTSLWCSHCDVRVICKKCLPVALEHLFSSMADMCSERNDAWYLKLPLKKVG